MRQITFNEENIKLELGGIYTFLGLTYLVPVGANFDITLTPPKSGLLIQKDSEVNPTYTKYFYVEVKDKKCSLYELQTEFEILQTKQKFLTKEEELKRTNNCTT